MNKSIKLTIISNWYPPDRRVSARRWGNLVSSLCNMGVDCTVISAGDGNYDEYIGDYGERVIRLPIANRATQNSQGKNKKNFPFKRSLKAMFSLIIPPLLLDFTVKRWILQPSLRAMLTKIAHESDCIVSSYGPLGPFLLGWWLARKTRKPWIADIRDSFESRDGKTSRPAKSLSRSLEARLLRKATMRITIGKVLANHLMTTYDIKFAAIYNGWTDTDIISRRNENKFVEPYLYYAGSIYEHRISALAIVLEAIHLKATQDNKKIKLKIRLLNDHTDGALTKLISYELAHEIIELLPPVDPKTVNEEIANSVGALVLEAIDDNDILRKGTVTGKLIGLLASGMPGIAISSKTGEIRELLNKVPGWYGVDDVKGCREALDKLLNHRSIDFNIEALMEFNVSRQAELFLQLVRKAIQ